MRNVLQKLAVASPFVVPLGFLAGCDGNNHEPEISRVGTSNSARALLDPHPVSEPIPVNSSAKMSRQGPSSVETKEEASGNSESGNENLVGGNARFNNFRRYVGFKNINTVIEYLGGGFGYKSVGALDFITAARSDEHVVSKGYHDFWIGGDGNVWGSLGGMEEIVVIVTDDGSFVRVPESVHDLPSE